MDSEKTVPQDPSTIKYEKAASFHEIYANNVFMEASLWDLKLILGQLSQQLAPGTVVQNASVTLPWAQVKVLRYFLGLHLLSHELQNGRVQIPPTIVTPIPKEFPTTWGFSGPRAGDIHAALRECYLEFITANPEAAPPDESTKSSKDS